MRPFVLYIMREYKVRMSSVAFWLVTLLTPVALWLCKLFMPQYEFAPVGEEAAGVDLGGVYLILFASALFMFVFFYGVQTMRSVAIVRRQRVVELLLMSIKPWEIVVGQIVAIGLVALTQLAIWLTAAWCVGFDLDVLGIGVTSVLWMLGGYVIYASLFAIAGVYVSSENASQAITLLISVISVIALNASIYAIANPGTMQSDFFALFPLTSPLMFGAGVNTGIYLQILSAVILILTCMALIAVGCRYFKRNCLV